MARTVFVTGASGGIGGAIACAFAKSGDRVAFGCHTRLDKAQGLAGGLQAQGMAVITVQGDVADEASVEEMILEIEAAYGPVDVLVNAAGFAQQKMLCDITVQEWDAMMDVHVKGTFLCCKRVLRSMVQRGAGNIVNIASMWGQVGASCEVHYSAAKGAVIALTKALAKEVAPSGVRVNCVSPGAIATPMMQGFSDEDLRVLCDETPLGRLGTPEEVAASVVFLASDSASFITGQILAPNGGFVV